MKRTNRIVKKVVVAAVLGSAVVLINPKDLYAGLGHVSCNLEMSYEYQGFNRSLGNTRRIEFDLVPGGSVQSEDLIRTHSLTGNQGPGFSFGYRIEGTYPGQQFSSNQPAQLTFSLLAPGSAATLPSEASRSASVTIPFVQEGPLASNRSIDVNWTTAVISRFCRLPVTNLRANLAGQIEILASYLEDPMYRNIDTNHATDGWRNLLEGIQNLEAGTRRLSSRDRAAHLQNIRQKKNELLALVQHDLQAPTNQREFVAFLKEKRNQLIQRLVWLRAEDRFQLNLETNSLMDRISAVIGRFESVLQAVGITDRDLTRGGYMRGVRSALNTAQRSVRGSASTRGYARLRSQAIQAAYGPNSSLDGNNILAENRLEGFNPENIQLQEDVCGIARIRVTRCVVSNAIPDLQARPGGSDAGVDGGTDAGVDASVAPTVTPETSNPTSADAVVPLTPEAVIDAGASSAEDAGLAE